MIKDQHAGRLSILLPVVSIFILMSCSEVKEKADEKWGLLNNKAKKLDSLINSEMIRVEQLDSLVKKEIKKMHKLDSIVDSKSSELDSLLNK